MLRRLHFTLALASMALLVSCKQETAYVFTYFDNSQQDAGLFLAYSYDGLNWTAYNDNKPVMRSEVGYNGILRDPSVCQGPDGVFHLVWTVSWNARSIGHAWSKDLVHWNDQKVVPVMEAFPSTRNTWAPELFYSKAEDLFYIFWASTVPDNSEVSTDGCISEDQYNHRIYCTTTRDFDTFSPTRLYFNPDFNAIDAAVVQVPGKEELIMVLKNENLHPAEKNIRLTRSTSMKDGFPTKVSAPISGIGMGEDAWAEGPSPLFIGKDLIVFYDLYRQHQYGASISHDNGATWEDATPLIRMPEGISHGTAIPVAKKFVDALTVSGQSNRQVTVQLAEGREPVPAGELGHNPICPMGVYMADPSAKVLDGKLYVACSLDLSPDYWCSAHHHMLSTDDLLHWTLHPNVLASEGPDDEVSYSDAYLYAPDIAEKDGKYYLYYDLSDWTEGVAEGDSPAGPFHDGQRIGDITGIDPCVFIDDDGQAYYFWDQFSARGAKLNPDMKTLDLSTLHEGIVTEKEHYFHEGSFVFKRDGWYYYVYADISRQNMPTCIGYSMSRNVFGPYEYKGVIIDSNGCDPDVWNNHGSVVEFGGKWYVLYHRSTHHGSKLRKACIEPITFNADGTINEVEMTSQGAGKPLSARETIDAARACLFNGGPHVRLMDGRTDREIVSGILDGSKAAWKYVDFDKAVTKLTIRVRPLAGGTISVAQDQSFHGRIASLDVPAGKGEWVTLSCEVGDVKEGAHALWLLFSGPGGDWKDKPELFELDWMVFE